MVDRISALLDELLCHILSFIPTKDAVATGVLSKRWRPLWRSVSALDFSLQRMHRGYYDSHGIYFSNIIYSVLLFRDPTTPIKKFNLKFHDVHLIDETIANVIKWINFVTQCRVGIQHLCLHVNSTPHNRLAPSLPISIFSCTTLVVLKLHGLYLTHHVVSTGLPSLKILHIKEVVFTSSLLLKQFLAGCPILENLRSGLIRITGKSPSYCPKLTDLCLPNLHRADIVHSRLPLQPFYNVTFLRADIEGYSAFPSFHNLTHLELVIELYDSHMLAKMLKHCPKLQSLVLERLVEAQKCDPENWTDPEFIPECLSCNLKTCTLKVEFQLARYVLKNAKVLQTMTIFNERTISQRQIRRKLFSGLRSSSTSRCQIIIHPI